MQLDAIGKYWDIRSESYSKSIKEEIDEELNLWEKRFEEELQLAPGSRILDLGCGPGMFTVVLTGMGYQVTALDYSEQMLVQAKHNLANTGRDAEFLQGDAGNLPFKTGTFDAIVTRNLTWNLENPEGAYEEWLRVLKDGGILLNFDGNHYLHYYNEDYRQEWDYAGLKSGHSHKYIGDVDVSVIDDIAKNLPLSSKERPAWDEQVLREMGAARVDIQLHFRNYKDEAGNERKIIGDFVIRVVK